ncbi:hypothetical protein K435DRAFT_720906 [Dendrothele bispora CBS 962.96]|uniref:DUF7726 domain-containing protein n=1 Tax=Dendrothele bispora (strain CBS 962.96) TaxID=1314807 RepID=A0A4S8M8B0_DENBC|nr:hypothetical protein K435DRAFT_720906 [Dendrothele bispora CBS 962.96]
MIILKNGERISQEELLNPFLLTDAKNLEWLDKREAEIDAKVASDKGKKTTTRGRDANDDDYREGVSGASKKASSKRAREDDDENDATNTSKPAKKAAKASSSKKSKEPVDLFSIRLDGDDNGTVEIYDSCDAVRRKINQHLMKGGTTKAQFMHDIARAAYPGDPPNIQTKQLQDFLTKKGPTAGSTSRVFYAAYVYFEKQRLSEGKPKSAHRKKMEEQWGNEGGMPRERARGYWAPQNYDVVQDKTGAVRTQRRY